MYGGSKISGISKVEKLYQTGESSEWNSILPPITAKRPLNILRTSSNISVQRYPVSKTFGSPFVIVFGMPRKPLNPSYSSTFIFEGKYL